MANDTRITFRATQQLEDRIKQIGFNLDVNASDLIRSAIIAGLPLVADQPALFFGINFTAPGNGSQSDS